MAAVLDALLQRSDTLAAEARRLIERLVARQKAGRDAARAKTQESRVDFTMAQRD